MTAARKLGLWSGVGIVIANMVGAGVLTVPGYMALSLAPSYILLAWLVGGIAALSGARAYAAVAQAIPRSGGEYRYLSTLWHPMLGYLAGWTSLFIGFSQPVALDTQLIGYYTGTLGIDIPWRVVTALVIVAVTALHAFDLRASRRGQNILVAIKIALVVGFVAVGLIAGSNTWPTWRPEASAHGLPVGLFFQNLVFIAFCYSGWNATIYASEEFAEPRRDVPRAMLIGCAVVIALYLLVNWVFVANLAPEHYGDWLKGDPDRITLGHVVMKHLVGTAGARIMSVFMIVALLSATSAMTMIGPRVYAAMARDGYLPAVFAGEGDRPPVGSVLLQGAIALAVAMTTSFIKAIATVGAVLTLMAALTALGVFKLQFDRRQTEKPGVPALIAAVIFIGLAGLMLFYEFTSPLLNTVELPLVGKVSSPLVWLAFVVAITVVYAAWGARRRGAAASRG
ncbi:MAG TPA: amino acid permease [Kofleriaceae bacterium]|jgi:APA family basic amino acid/polyamine antiporter|nr:amino acid permease [Kofleriaceae bacterium]